jgi:hypothetical protein
VFAHTSQAQARSAQPGVVQDERRGIVGSLDSLERLVATALGGVLDRLDNVHTLEGLTEDDLEVITTICQYRQTVTVRGGIPDLRACRSTMK